MTVKVFSVPRYADRDASFGQNSFPLAVFHSILSRSLNPLMNRPTLIFIALLSILLFFCPITHTFAGSLPNYTLNQEIPVGGDGGWDYLNIDEANNRLFVSHSDRVIVIDLNTSKVVGELPDTPGVHGTTFSSDRAFTSNGKENKIGIFDLKSLKPIGKVDAGKNPDCIVYEPVHQEVYAFNGRSQSVMVLDAKTSQIVCTIPISGKPEYAVVSPNLKSGRIYFNVQDRNEVCAINTSTHQVVNSWPIAPAEQATGIAIDPQTERLFIVSHNKKTLVMMDGFSGRILATAPIGTGVDGVCFDPETKLVFSSNGEGSVTIVHVDDPDRLSVVQTLQTKPGTRTMALDPKTKSIYLSSATLEASPESSLGSERHWVREKTVPGSFKILMYSPRN